MFVIAVWVAQKQACIDVHPFLILLHSTPVDCTLQFGASEQTRYFLHVYASKQECIMKNE